MIFSNNDYSGTKGIIRIDGSVHDTKKRKTYDKHQTIQLWKRGVKVFVIRNEEIYNASPKNLLALAYGIYHMLGSEDKYSQYVISERHLLGWADKNTISRLASSHIS
jgi:hypothetical protein